SRKVRGRRLVMLAVSIATAAWLCPLRVGIVQGHSMDPTLHTGQVLAVDHSYYRHQPVSVGDVVLFHGEHGVYVKRVLAIGGQTVTLIEDGTGDAKESTPVARGSERKIAALAAKGLLKLRRVPVPSGAFFALGDAI